MSKKRVLIIGAGPGGLSAAMILAHRGYEVKVIERLDRVGGRNSLLKLGDFSFELGPTFVMLPQSIDEAFTEAGEKMSDHLELKELEPMYRLSYGDGREFDVFFNKEKLKTEIKRLFPGEEENYNKYFARQKKKFERLFDCLKIPYLHWYNYLRWKLLKALPVVGLTQSVYKELKKYFSSSDISIAMAFQSKYLGMSPWQCPAGFTIISYVEHAFGIWHPLGGVCKISQAMAKVAQTKGAEILLNKEVKQIIFQGKKATGVELTDGQIIEADAVIMNTDFAYGMTHLIKSDLRKKYTDKNLAQRDYSCSIFMLYFGLDKKYEAPHHNIFFSSDYEKNISEIYDSLELSANPSFYLQNACQTDPNLAPAGKSALYVLVPVPNLKAKIDWSKEKQALRDLIIKKIEERSNFKDLSSHIEVEKIITPLEWQNDYKVYDGAVFNLAHSLDQMLYLRPRNRLEGYENLYVVGGGTHPGSGLPTIIQSGRISADLISQSLKNYL